MRGRGPWIRSSSCTSRPTTSRFACSPQFMHKAAGRNHDAICTVAVGRWGMAVCTLCGQCRQFLPPAGSHTRRSVLLHAVPACDAFRLCQVSTEFCAQIDPIKPAEVAGSWLTGIAEVELPAHYKLKNIEETEAVKKRMLQPDPDSECAALRTCFRSYLSLLRLLFSKAYVDMCLASIESQLPGSVQQVKSC